MLDLLRGHTMSKASTASDCRIKSSQDKKAHILYSMAVQEHPSYCLQFCSNCNKDKEKSSHSSLICPTEGNLSFCILFLHTTHIHQFPDNNQLCLKLTPAASAATVALP